MENPGVVVVFLGGSNTSTHTQNNSVRMQLSWIEGVRRRVLPMPTNLLKSSLDVWPGRNLASDQYLSQG